MPIVDTVHGFSDYVPNKFGDWWFKDAKSCKKKCTHWFWNPNLPLFGDGNCKPDGCKLKDGTYMWDKGYQWDEKLKKKNSPIMV